jgi:hypothetical protein
MDQQTQGIIPNRGDQEQAHKPTAAFIIEVQRKEGYISYPQTFKPLRQGIKHKKARKQQQEQPTVKKQRALGIINPPRSSIE